MHELFSMYFIPQEKSFFKIKYLFFCFPNSYTKLKLQVTPEGRIPLKK